jgi:predicted transcriptional regulator
MGTKPHPEVRDLPEVQALRRELADLLRKAGLSQKTLATRTGYTASAVSYLSAAGAARTG